jgi:hypothetical protein
MSVICRSPHRTLFRTAVLCTTLVVFAGCGAEKESTHEDSHEKPAHWPGSLNEAADFMDARLQLLETSDSEVSVVRDELTDLVTWAPEIAADTDLSEEDWLPIYELSEAVRLHLLPGDVDPLLIESDFDRLCKLLRDAGVTVESLRQQSRAATVPDDLEAESGDDAADVSPQD